MNMNRFTVLANANNVHMMNGMNVPNNTVNGIPFPMLQLIAKQKVVAPNNIGAMNAVAALMRLQNQNKNGNPINLNQRVQPILQSINNRMNGMPPLIPGGTTNASMASPFGVNGTVNRSSSGTPSVQPTPHSDSAVNGKEKYGGLNALVQAVEALDNAGNGDDSTSDSCSDAETPRKPKSSRKRKYDDSSENDAKDPDYKPPQQTAKRRKPNHQTMTS